MCAWLLFILTTMKGRIVYVSDSAAYGSLGDLSHFNDESNVKEFLESFGGGKVMIRNNEYTRGILGMDLKFKVPRIPGILL